MENARARAAADAEIRRYLRTKAAACYLGIAESTLIAWRRERRGPPVCRVSVNRCLYDVLLLDAFMSAHAGFERQPVATTAASRP